MKRALKETNQLHAKTLAHVRNLFSINMIKKKSYTRAILVVFALVLGVLPMAAQRNVYVSSDGTGSGNGTPAAPISFSSFQTILSGHTSGTNSTLNIYFKGGTYLVSSPLSIPTSSAAITGLSINFDRMSDSDIVIFKGNNNHRLIYNNDPGDATEANPYRITFKNIIFDSFSNGSVTGTDAVTSTECFVHNYLGYNHIFTFDHVTIQNCNTNAHLFHTYSGGSKINIINSSIINNNRGSNRDIVNFRWTYPTTSGNNYIYNNTFSNNTARNCINFSLAEGSNTRVFNNTFYNTGLVNINFNTYNPRFINNIVAGTSTYSLASGVMAYRNTQPYAGSLYYNVVGNSGGINITTAFNQQFSKTLSNSTAPGSQVHQILMVNDPEHVILNKGLTQAELVLATGMNLLQDQLGQSRPTGDILLSMGAVDALRYVIKAPTIQIGVSYNSAESIAPNDTTINLANNIIGFPPSSNLANTTFFISDSTNTDDAFSITGSQLTFTPPALGSIAAEYKITYGVKNDAGYETFGYVIIKLVDNALPPGYVDPTDYPQTCFDYMGRVDFTSAYRWRNEEVNLHGFTIPLVGDLNGDGSPEILGMRTSGAYVNGYFDGVVIYNGQTGAVINNIPFSNLGLGTLPYYHQTYHGPPSNMALVDSDRDGTVELILAVPYGGSSPRTINSYNLVYDKNTGNYSPERRWGPISYSNDNSYAKPIPQVVDLDGDGTPEVIVYNKVYNASTGDLLMTIETLGTNAYVGMDANAYGGPDTGDRYVNFSYVYDMDGDGIYDLVAGGKIYRFKKNPSTGVWSYDIIQMSGTPDGRTGVADIDGDGKPDVVVVRRTGATIASSIRIAVWTPDFAAPGGTATPRLIASRDIVVPTGYAEGTNSYVYIGDINGSEEIVGGVKYRLPEIAVLTTRISLSEANFPRHSTVPAGGIPTSYSTASTAEGGGLWGSIFAVTFEKASGELKASFLMEHWDSSIDTGFTMFDFDNDGTMEICYRDRTTLRIIKASKPYVSITENDPNVILFKQSVRSETGFEFPVIADLDNDASAEMAVVGSATTGYMGGMFVVGNGVGDKFAPARPVWNQAMYDPFKINDDLTTPIGPAKDRLAYKYQHEIKDVNGNVVRTIENYRPYNNTLGQIARFTTLPNGPGVDDSFEPIIFLTNAYIVPETGDDGSRPKMIATGPGAAGTIEITVGNKSTAKTDISANTPITVYKKGVSSTNYYRTFRLNQLNVAGTSTPLSYAIKAGSEVRLEIPVDNAYELYIVRLGDNSGNAAGTAWEAWRFGTNNGGTGMGDIYSNPPVDASQGIGISSRAYRDCDWRDQTVKAALISVNMDVATVQQFGQVLLDIIGNDEYPSDLPSDQKIVSNIIKSSPAAGELRFVNNQVLYINNGGYLEHGIDSFRYEITYTPPSTSLTLTFTAHAYIYVLESATGGFAACYGDNYTATLREAPTGVKFYWYDQNGNNIGGFTNPSLSMPVAAITQTKVFQVRPEIPSTFNGENIVFPNGELTISVANPGTGTNAVMRWTGNIDTNWHNPKNWVEVKNGVETPVLFVPTSCVDVVIPTGAVYYPMLTKAAVCNKITMEDRAMLAGIEFLTYAAAEVDLRLTPTERERFVMWSAPLKDTYSGDYHLTRSGGNPVWGDVYMNFFQSVNPDNGAAIGNMLTATFGDLGTALPLGRAFNLKIENTLNNKDSLFRFPRTFTQYTDNNGKPYNVSNRNNSKRFISDDINTTLNTMPVLGDVASSNGLVQVVNPYMAYLDMNQFLNNNPTLTGYMIWNGKTGSESNDFVTVKYDNSLTPGQRYLVDNTKYASQAATFRYVAPLQSFFVNRGATPISSVQMRSAWTTTQPGVTNGYELRDNEVETNILRISATQGSKSSGTMLRHKSGALPTYMSNEDAKKGFFPEIGLSIYSLTEQRVALAINTKSDFAAVETPIGIRYIEAGTITLEFDGLETFGYDVTLIDKKLNKAVDITQTPTYSFTVDNSIGDIVELNDRISLQMRGNGSVGNETVDTKDWVVSAKDGNSITVESLTGVISQLQVYTLQGALYHTTDNQATRYTIPVKRDQMYVVKAVIGGKVKSEIVIVHK